MKLRNAFLASLALALLLAVPRPSLAESVGMSPPQMDLTVYQGDVLHEEIHFTRSEAAGDRTFSVSSSDSELIDLLGQTEFTIPDGSTEGTFSFDVNAERAEIGDTDNRLTFIVAVSDADLEAGGSLIQYGLAEKIAVHVVPRPDSSVTLNVGQYRPLMKEVGISEPKVTVTRSRAGHLLHVSWSLSNSGKNPLEKIPTDIVITQHGNTMETKRLVSSGSVPPNGTSEETYDFLIPSAQASGTENIAVTVGDHTVSTSVWVLQPKMRKQIMVVLAGLLGMVLVAGVTLALDRHRSKRRDYKS